MRVVLMTGEEFTDDAKWDIIDLLSYAVRYYNDENVTNTYYPWHQVRVIHD